MTSIHEKLKDCNDTLDALYEKRADLMKRQVELEKKANLVDILMKLQDDYGEKMFEDVSMEMLDLDHAVGYDTPPDYNPNENKLSSEDIKFYEEYYPKRAGKHGVVGVTFRKQEHNGGTVPSQPWKFTGYSWLTKSRVYRAFSTKSQAVGFAKGVWNKYPTEEYIKYCGK